MSLGTGLLSYSDENKSLAIEALLEAIFNITTSCKQSICANTTLAELDIVWTSPTLAAVQAEMCSLTEDACNTFEALVAGIAAETWTP